MNIGIRRVCCSAALLSAVALSACKEKQGAIAAGDAGEVARYTVRGQVAQVPVAGDIKSEFRVRHEAIPEYRQAGGKLGMNTMTMPFPVGDALTLNGIEVGDIVRLTFAVEYDTGYTKLRRYYAVEVEELPPDTELDFSPLPKDE